MRCFTGASPGSRTDGTGVFIVTELGLRVPDLRADSGLRRFGAARQRLETEDKRPETGDLIAIVSIYIIHRRDREALKTPWYYILVALAAGDRHGLAIAREVLELSDGLVRLWPATLYGALEDLCDRGWIEELDVDKGTAGGRERAPPLLPDHPGRPRGGVGGDAAARRSRAHRPIARQAAPRGNAVTPARSGWPSSTGICSALAPPRVCASATATRWRRCFSKRSPSRQRSAADTGVVWVAAAWDIVRARVRSVFRRRRSVPGLPVERHNLMLGTDLRYTLRWLARQKLSTSLVVGMLSVGMAANVVVFSLVSALFLRPFPFPDPDRLVDINETAPRWNLDVVGINYPDFHQWRQAAHAFEGLAMYEHGQLQRVRRSGRRPDRGRVGDVRFSGRPRDRAGTRPDVHGRGGSPEGTAGRRHRRRGSGASDSAAAPMFSGARSS